MTDEERAALLHRALQSHDRWQQSRDRYVLVRLSGGEPVDALICLTPNAALFVVEALELPASDYRIVVARQM